MLTRDNIGDIKVTEKMEIRAVVGLTEGLPNTDLEALTVGAIRSHRQLVEKAQQLFDAMPDEYKAGKASGGTQHRAYIEAAMEMHAQMAVLNTLLNTLGHVPKVTVN